MDRVSRIRPLRVAWLRRALQVLGIIGVACAPWSAGAQASVPDSAAASPHTLTANVTLISDYRFRGISQTYTGPSIQGGLDYSHASGLYLGSWNASVASQLYTGGSGIEMDLYGGFRRSFGAFALDVGALLYHYPNALYESSGIGNKKYDTEELYVGGSWRWLAFKYSRAISDYFGLGPTLVNGGYWINQRDGSLLRDRGGSRGTGYADLTVGAPITEKFAFSAHVGRSRIQNYPDLDYTDWKVGATYTLHGLVLGAAAVGTDADDGWYYGGGSKGNRSVGAGTLLVSVSRTF